LGLGLAAGQWLATAFPVLVLLHLWTATHLVILAAAVTVAASGDLPRALAISLVALLAVIIGADIQPEGPALSEKAEAAAATFLTGALLLLAIGWLVSRRMPQWAELAIRIVAAWIAASALMVLAFLFR
jgi:hypothetical protein